MRGLGPLQLRPPPTHRKQEDPLLPASVKKALLLWQPLPLPCRPAAEIALQPLIWRP